MNQNRTIVCCLFAAMPAWAAGVETNAELETEFRIGVSKIASLSEKMNIRVKVDATSEQSKELLSLDYSPELLAKLKANRDDPSKQTMKREYALREKSMLHIAKDLYGKDIVAAKNDSYAFMIQRVSGKSAYSIQFLEQLRMEPKIEDMINSTAQEGLGTILGAWSILGERMDSLVVSPEFQIIRIAKASKGGSGLVQVDFRRPLAKVSARHLSYGDSYMICDPEKHWGLVEYAATLLNLDGSVAQHREVHLDFEVVESVPIPLMMTVTTVLAGGTKVVEKGSTKLEIVSRNVPAEDFLISSFGLPEPNFKTGFSQRFWYVTIVAVGCLGAAWVMRRFKRRS